MKLKKKFKRILIAIALVAVVALVAIILIKLPKKPGLITLSDYDIYNYFHNSGNWKAEIFRFIGKIDFLIKF